MDTCTYALTARLRSKTGSISQSASMRTPEYFVLLLPRDPVGWESSTLRYTPLGTLTFFCQSDGSGHSDFLRQRFQSTDGSAVRRSVCGLRNHFFLTSLLTNVPQS